MYTTDATETEPINSTKDAIMANAEGIVVHIRSF